MSWYILCPHNCQSLFQINWLHSILDPSIHYKDLTAWFKFISTSFFQFNLWKTFGVYFYINKFEKSLEKCKIKISSYFPIYHDRFCMSPLREYLELLSSGVVILHWTYIGCLLTAWYLVSFRQEGIGLTEEIHYHIATVSWLCPKVESEEEPGM